MFIESLLYCDYLCLNYSAFLVCSWIILRFLVFLELFCVSCSWIILRFLFLMMREVFNRNLWHFNSLSHSFLRKFFLHKQFLYIKSLYSWNPTHQRLLSDLLSRDCIYTVSIESNSTNFYFLVSLTADSAQWISLPNLFAWQYLPRFLTEVEVMVLILSNLPCCFFF